MKYLKQYALNWILYLVTNVIGWIMSASFTGCGVPQAWKSYRDGHSKGLSLYFLLLWIIGEVCGVFYSFEFTPFPWPLFINYSVSTIITFIIMKYYFFPRDKNGNL